MGEEKYEVRIFEEVREFIRDLDIKDRAKIAATIKMMEFGDFQSIEIKTLKGQIKELIVRSYRIVFFIIKNRIIYFVSGFRKKTQKTPKNEIDNAQKILNIFKNKK